jgi:hypothetical protein
MPYLKGKKAGVANAPVKMPLPVKIPYPSPNKAT